MGKLFLQENGRLVPLPERGYRDKEVGNKGEQSLQDRLEQHPELIPSEEINADKPPRFLVLKREASVPGIGAIDLLLVDDSAVLTIVETKLADNPEIRRDVVGQILEYAAHQVREWDRKRTFEESQAYWVGRKSTLRAATEEAFGPGKADLLWDQLSQNVKSGRVRLIIAADKLTQPVKRVIEFLNNFAEFEVYGLEIGFFAETDKGRTILAPRLVGQTERTMTAKPGRVGTVWDKERFFSEMVAKAVPQAEIEAVKQILELVEREFDVDWGAGTETGTYSARLNGRGVLYVSTKATICTAFVADWSGWPKVIPKEKLNQFRPRFEAILGRPINANVDGPTYRGRTLADKKKLGDVIQLIQDTKTALLAG